MDIRSSSPSWSHTGKFTYHLKVLAPCPYTPTNICATNNIKCDVNTPSKHEYHKSTSTYSHAANSLLKTIDFNLEDIKQWAILDSGATSIFLLSDALMDDERPP